MRVFPRMRPGGRRRRRSGFVAGLADPPIFFSFPSSISEPVDGAAVCVCVCVRARARVRREYREAVQGIGVTGVGSWV